MRILLVNPHYPFSPRTVLLHPPLAYGYLARSLKQDGHDVRVADLPLEGNCPESLRTYISCYKPDLIGITCVSKSYTQALEIARFCKESTPVPIVMGGPHVSFIPNEVLDRHKCVDFVVLFDGDDTIRYLVHALEATGVPNRCHQIPGLAYRVAGHIVVNDPCPPVLDLERYGSPDRSVFSLERYRSFDYETIVMTARGCPSKCSFCSSSAAGRRYRRISAVSVCREVEEVLGLGFTSIFFGDDTFSADKHRTMLFCNEIKRRRLSFPWTSNMRQSDSTNPRLLEAMRKAGAYRVFMGFESINIKTLTAFRKGTTAERLYKASLLLREAGIELHASFIIGAPWDTNESLEATLDYIRLINPTIATFNTMEPRPGTDLYTRPSVYGVTIPDPYWYEKTDWLQSPVCHTQYLSSREIGQWVSRCYAEFCSNDFRSHSRLKKATRRIRGLEGSDRMADLALV